MRTNIDLQNFYQFVFLWSNIVLQSIQDPIFDRIGSQHMRVYSLKTKACHLAGIFEW